MEEGQEDRRKRLKAVADAAAQSQTGIPIVYNIKYHYYFIFDNSCVI